MWLSVGYNVSATILRDATRFSSNLTGGFGGMGGLSNTMVFVDPPDHTRLRAAVQKGFNPRTIAALEPRVREITRSLLDKIKPGEPFELMSGLARPLPVIVIAVVGRALEHAADDDHELGLGQRRTLQGNDRGAAQGAAGRPDQHARPSRRGRLDGRR
jgi:cytochrome P450